MRKFTFKSLLIAAALCLGTSAWAQETTTLCEYGTTENPWTGTNLTDFTGNAITLSDYGAYYTTSNNSGDASTKIIAPAENSIINVDAYWYGMSNTGRNFSNNNGIYFRFGNVFVAQNDQDQKHGYGFNGIANMSSVTTFTGTNKYRNYDISTKKFLHIEMEINTATNTLTYFRVSEEGSESYLVNVENTLLDSPNYTTIEWGYKKGGSVKLQRYEYLKSIKVTQTTQTVATKEYTINYKFGEETIYTTSGELAVGGTVETKSVITVGEDKYLSVEDAQQLTITADGTNTWDIEVRKPYTATVSLVNTIAGEDSAPITKTFTETDDKVCTWTVGYPMYVLKDGVYYKLDGDIRGESGTFEDKQTINKTANYTNADNTVAYFTEVEDISTTSLTSFNANYSAGHCSAIAANGKTICTLEAGAYKVETYIQANTNRGFFLRDGNNGDNNTNTMCSGSAIGTYTGSFVIGTSTPIIISGYTNAQSKLNQSSELDYVLITKVPNPTVTITAGYATFSSTYAVDFSESGLTAYTATVSENKVVMTPIENGIVPANTGVILKGAAGYYTGVITTTEAVIENNDLVAATEEIPSLATETTVDEVTYKNYILNVVNETPGFYQANDKKVAAGKAYLQVLAATVAEAKALTIVWNDGETTGIEENYEFGTMNSDAATFDLSGRKVANPAKGLYIKNGKKFIVK